MKADHELLKDSKNVAALLHAVCDAAERVYSYNRDLGDGAARNRANELLFEAFHRAFPEVNSFRDLHQRLSEMRYFVEQNDAESGFTQFILRRTKAAQLGLTDKGLAMYETVRRIAGAWCFIGGLAALFSLLRAVSVWTLRPWNSLLAGIQEVDAGLIRNAIPVIGRAFHFLLYGFTGALGVFEFFLLISAPVFVFAWVYDRSVLSALAVLRRTNGLNLE